MIDGAVWRIAQFRDMTAELAVWIMAGAGNKFQDGPPTVRHFLGRDPLPLDPRPRPRDLTAEAMSEADAVVAADKARRARAMFDAALAGRALLDKERAGGVTVTPPAEPPTG